MKTKLFGDEYTYFSDGTGQGEGGFIFVWRLNEGLVEFAGVVGGDQEPYFNDPAGHKLYERWLRRKFFKLVVNNN